MQCAHLQLKEDVKAAANTTEPARGECLVQMLAPPHTRDGLGYLLEAEGLKAGAELGVQVGAHGVGLAAGKTLLKHAVVLLLLRLRLQDCTAMLALFAWHAPLLSAGC